MTTPCSLCRRPHVQTGRLPDGRAWCAACWSSMSGQGWVLEIAGGG